MQGFALISSGFVIVGGNSRTGWALRRLLAARGSATAVLVRGHDAPTGPEHVIPVTDYFDPPEQALAGKAVLINCTGVTHGHNSALLDRVNTKGPVRLATKAKACGVRHFIHLSSFKVYGAAQDIRRETPEEPDTVYGHSKLKADLGLRALADDQFAVTILRLPMLYGGGAGDNLYRIGRLMMRLPVFPVPRRMVRRSVLHIDNLAVILAALAQTPLNGTVVAADEDPFTHETLAAAIGKATGKQPRLVALPDFVFTPMRLVLPGLYNKVYESKYAPQDERFAPGELLPVSLRNGLVDMFSPKGHA